MLTEVALQSVITVVDAAQLAERSINPAGRTYRLMADQIRCATRVILNKTDLIPPSELLRLEAVIRELNPVAPIIPTVRCEMDLTVLDHPDGGVKDRYKETQPAGVKKITAMTVMTPSAGMKVSASPSQPRPCHGIYPLFYPAD